jgi:hypothetical protein
LFDHHLHRLVRWHGRQFRQCYPEKNTPKFMQFILVDTNLFEFELFGGDFEYLLTLDMHDGKALKHVQSPCDSICSSVPASPFTCVVWKCFTNF